MSRAVVDSNVLLGAFSERDQHHEAGLSVVRGVDRRELPKGVIPSFTLPELVNPAQKREGRTWAVDKLERIENSSGFEIEWLSRESYATGLAVWRGLPGGAGAEFTDAAIAQFMRARDIEYIYSFDDDFDAFRGITRVNAAVDPFEA